eukprot:174679-Prorocentrum_minimum.AAC.2
MSTNYPYVYSAACSRLSIAYAMGSTSAMGSTTELTSVVVSPTAPGSPSSACDSCRKIHRRCLSSFWMASSSRSFSSSRPPRPPPPSGGGGCASACAPLR